MMSYHNKKIVLKLLQEDRLPPSAHQTCHVVSSYEAGTA